MLFFRSEEHVREWCGTHGHPQRPVVTMEQLWALSRIWFKDRMEPGVQRPQPAEIVEIFARCGLTGSFWDPLAEPVGSSS